MEKTLLFLANFFNTLFFISHNRAVTASNVAVPRSKELIGNIYLKMLFSTVLLVGIMLFKPTTAAAQTPVNVCVGETSRFTSKLPDYAYQARWLISYDNGNSWYIEFNYTGNYGDNIWYEFSNTPLSYNGYRLVAQYYYNGWYDIPNSYYRLTVNARPAAPTVTNGSRVGSGTVTLRASGTGSSYRWYTAATGGTPISDATSATYTTPELTTSRTYYVSAVSSQGCEGARQAVSATINPLPDGAVVSPKVILYHENFSGTLTGITTDTEAATGRPHWLTSATTTYITSNSAQASAGGYLRTNLAITNTLNRNLYLNNAISTVGYENIKIIWTNRQTYAGTTKPGLFYRIDGGAWKQATGWETNTTIDSNRRLVNSGNYISLPAEVANAQNLSFAWVVPNQPAGADMFYALDDITLIGTPTAGLSTFAWGGMASGTKPISSSAATPAAYTVDGVNMKWTGPGANYLVKEGVYNDEFQNPAYSYTQLQEFATATAGTKTILTLDKAVEDLTFTLIDIDRSVNQFRDKLVIKGYKGATLVPLNKYKVVHTSNNEARVGEHIISGAAAGLEVPAASPEGNVTITFAGAIDRMELEYYNEEPTRNANGRQGFAIRDLHWRRIPVSMPVELISFKGYLQNNHAHLVWSTAMEKNNDKFIIERSQNGEVFTAIGEVKGNGTSSSIQKYSFTDVGLLPGTTYYRLRQLDFDGKEALSHVVAVEHNTRSISTEATIAGLYPTVASELVNIQLNSELGDVALKVLDASGKLIQELTGSGGQTISLPVQQFRAGIYLVTVADERQKQVLKFIKQ